MSASATGTAFGHERSDVSYGTCDVSIPRDHRMGEVERPSIWKLEFREDSDKHVVVLATIPQAKDAFFQQVSDRVNSSDGKRAFIFVHGYRVTFEEAAQRTAQISYDLGFEGAPVFYSWPSQGTFHGYPVDETNIEWSQPNLRAFLADFVKFSEAQSIYLIAHSMGNRALTRAFGDLAKQAPEASKKIRELVLTAPDIDAQVFERDIAPQICGSALATLYASSADKALLASKEFHGYARAGDSGGAILLVPGLETIDATAVDTSFMGHSYFAESRSVLSDIFYLIRDGTRAEKRFGLKAVDTASGRYWVFKQ